MTLEDRRRIIDRYTCHRRGDNAVMATDIGATQPQNQDATGCRNWGKCPDFPREHPEGLESFYYLDFQPKKLILNNEKITLLEQS